MPSSDSLFPRLRSQLANLPLPLLLALLSAIPPLAIDMYLPAMALMAEDLNTGIHQIEMSVSTFLIGYAAGQLIGGPLSDRFGRRPVILLGLTVFMLTSMVLVLSENLTQLLLWRVVQALGGGMATVNSAAVIRDKFSGNRVAQTLSMVAMIMMLAPLLAPLLGSLLLSLSDWRSIFVALSVYSLMVLVILFWQLGETLPREQRQSQPPWRSYGEVLSHSKARGYILALSFAFSGMFIFITAAPYLYLQHFDQTPHQFPWLFGANILVMMLLNRTNVALLKKHSPWRVMRLGLLLQFLSGGALALQYNPWLSLPFTPDLWTTVPCIMVFVGSLGLIAANSISLVLHYFRHISGVATAVIGVTEFCLGALLGLIWAQLHDLMSQPSPWPMMLMMLLCAVLALWFSRRAPDAQPATETAEQ